MFKVKYKGTRMTTSISIEAIWNINKYVWTSENWYGNQKVEKESMKIKENHKIFLQLVKTFTFMSFVA